VTWGGSAWAIDKVKSRDSRKPGNNEFPGLLDALNDAVICFDDGLRILYLNKAARGIFGRAPSEAVGRSLGLLFPARSRDGCIRNLEESARTVARLGRPHSLGMLWWRRSSGENFPADGALSTLDIAGRRVLTAVLRDLTERRRIEQSVRDSEQRFRLLADAAPVMIWMADPDGMCTYFNKVWLDFTGRRMEEETGNGWSAGVHPEDLDQCMETYLSALEGGRDFEVQYRLRRADGQYRWILDHGRPLRLSEGGITGYIGSCIDITDLKQTEAKTLRLKERLHAENSYLQNEIRLVHGADDLVGRSPGFLEALRLAGRVAPTDSTVLLLGETGTGKELLARTIHARSPRGMRPLIKVDLAAVPPILVESELFARIELADGGTIFLDEIGELPARLEKRLVKLIREGVIVRKGGAPVKVDTRVIASTNRAVRKNLRAGVDLFEIHVPPLRRRREDIPLLAELFTQRISRRLGKRIDAVPPEVIEALAGYSWPGNVREMANILELAVLRAKGHSLSLEDLDIDPAPAPRAAADSTLSAVQRDHILRTLHKAAWKIEGRAGAAERLGLNPSTLRSRMRKLGIRRPFPPG